ncbi:LacI family DNA-binding transcriptional regulator [Puniceicoccus vermicola]|uniref:LacI family DNA-binding transcriptional regulator n=1 Tax=Puniceicoccus vermicola TaxID=388746 RepID=A0A7X1E536_9BACT|nr:LacI family DNA-binding transcriptional regulator [Puniceicoccus vermicola]MBC2602628.1 LacI family DNA-binding transcriptional regulator [Puniceicoccus vermicola]
MKSRVSMRDIAREANVSVMTVSLALRNSPRVKQQTGERVRAVAKQMGFTPDPALRALISYRNLKSTQKFRGSIAYINNTPEPNLTQTSPLHSQIFSGATERGESLGYMIREFWMHEEGLKSQRASQILLSRGIQGLVLGPQTRAHSEIEMDWQHFSVVQLGFSLEAPRFHLIFTDIFAVVARIFQELANYGYRRIGLVLQKDQDERVQNRYSGAYLAMQNKLPKRLKRIPVFSESQAKEKIGLWYDKYKPDAIIGGPELFQHLQAVRELKTPEDIGYACPFYLKRVEGMAHADGRQDEVGRKSMEILSSLIERNERGIPDSRIIHLLEPSWTPGSTLRRVGSPVSLAS